MQKRIHSPPPPPPLPSSSLLQEEHQQRHGIYTGRIILIHGWLGGSTAGLYNTLIPELLAAPNARHNIITVDWGKGAIADYITASYRVKPVGKVLAKFIDFLHQESGMRFEDLQVIGFSMGAHVAGIAGKFLQTGRLTAIYALDPALPLFRYENQEERVDRSDAEYVEVLHTSVGSYGYDRPLGHVDFYVNFGSHQPGCYLKECSHFRAFQIFSQALSREKLEGFGCDEDMWQEMLRQHKCPHETGQKLQIAPHYSHFNRTLMAKRRGVFYLLTNAQPPYRIQK
uniref:Lipase domain-containing protein n=1 Tax=Musca domestica TaxID=7370 RepID=A0A1I8N6C4_MUSDO